MNPLNDESKKVILIECILTKLIKLQIITVKNMWQQQHSGLHLPSNAEGNAYYCPRSTTSKVRLISDLFISKNYFCT